MYYARLAHAAQIKSIYKKNSALYFGIFRSPSVIKSKQLIQLLCVQSSHGADHSIKTAAPTMSATTAATERRLSEAAVAAESSSLAARLIMLTLPV